MSVDGTIVVSTARKTAWPWVSIHAAQTHENVAGPATHDTHIGDTFVVVEVHSR
jgi:hypothetical protein